jgi:hypothetical protein
MRRITRDALLLLLVTLLTAAGSLAGTMSLAWDPVGSPDLAGYRVYYGTTPGSYTSTDDVGDSTTATLVGLEACARYYVAVKAYDTGGAESSVFSNEISGLPRPVVSLVTPASVERGTSTTLTVSGESFADGAGVEFSGTGVSVTAVRLVSCTELSVDVQVALSAAEGARDVTVVNSDGSYGTASGAVTVTANAAPSVSSASPPDGSVDVAVGVRPSVTFSEPMDASSIGPGTVRLLDAAGQAVAQAAGSPQLSGDGVTATITPAESLPNDQTFRTSVLGGAGGVRDASGVEMAAGWEQQTGFTTVAAPDTTGPQVTGTSPSDGAGAVPVGVAPQLTFDEPVDPATVTPETVLLVDAEGRAVAQSSGSPSLSADGMTVTVTPAAELAENATYRLRVLGGPAGVADEAGNRMDATFEQAAGFTTENLPPPAVTNLRRTDVR